MSKVVLVRSPNELIKENQIGYGWARVDFSEHGSTESVINAIKVEYGGIKRSANQVSNYFNLKKGDLVVVPLAGAIAIARVDGKKTYVKHSDDHLIKNGENRIAVRFLKSKNGSERIPRKQLPTNLEARLKIRMSIARLDAFTEEIISLVDGLERGDLNTIGRKVAEKIDSEQRRFTAELLRRLQNNSKIAIKAGGTGLELLIKELLEIEGYQARIPGKKQNNGIGDIDVKATKINSITGEEEALLIQAKHHKGTSRAGGINQLIALKDAGNKIFMTTATALSDDAKALAEENDIVVRTGDELVVWIYENINQLSESTREKLGVAIVPILTGDY